MNTSARSWPCRADRSTVELSGWRSTRSTSSRLKNCGKLRRNLGDSTVAAGSSSMYPSVSAKRKKLRMVTKWRATDRLSSFAVVKRRQKIDDVAARTSRVERPRLFANAQNFSNVAPVGLNGVVRQALVDPQAVQKCANVRFQNASLDPCGVHQRHIPQGRALLDSAFNRSRRRRLRSPQQKKKLPKLLASQYPCQGEIGCDGRDNRACQQSHLHEDAPCFRKMRKSQRAYAASSHSRRHMLRFCRKIETSRERRAVRSACETGKTAPRN